MPKGYLRIQVMRANGAKPIANAMVRIYQNQNEEIINESYHISNTMGIVESVPLESVDASLSLDENNRIRPYSLYNVEIKCSGYETFEIIGLQIFSNIHSTLPINLIPTIAKEANIITSYIPDHQLLIDSVSHEDELYPPVGRILSRVSIPKRVVVHLGRPSSSAENISVDFIEYIKNVASSEIYPTWEENALRANIYCQISLILNRIFTEWYPSKGYNFDITNSTAFDQAFVKNRNIFDNISEIVDEIFNEYIQKDEYVEPYYAEYCDGKIASCPGLKQWGTQTLALQGYSPIEILQYYYGDLVKIITTNHIQEIKQSYPGTPIKLGSSGIDVTIIQKQLNAIAVNYPSITPIYPIDGIYGTQSEEAVKVFQKQFSLTVDGIIGKATWYKISYVYVAVRKLAELTSIGIRDDLYNGAYPGEILQYNSRGIEVQFLQYLLQVIATYDDEIREINKIDGIYGNATYLSVISFQKKYGLTQDGIVGKITWNRIYEIYLRYKDNIIGSSGIVEWPGYLFTTGNSGEDVKLIQEALNIVGTMYTILPILVIDGYYGSNTKECVAIFQSIAQLKIDGIVGRDTWIALFTLAEEIRSGSNITIGIPTFPNEILKLGSSGESVRFIQERLAFISIYYTQIPTIQTDGIFGILTREAVLSFQEMLGLEMDGIVGEITWYAINIIYTQLLQN